MQDVTHKNAALYPIKLEAERCLDGIIEQIAIDLQHFVKAGSLVPKEYPHLDLMQKMGIVSDKLLEHGDNAGSAYQLTQKGIDMYASLMDEQFY